MKAKGIYVEGKMDGEWLYFHENGKTMLQEEYKLGIETGLWIEYDEQGIYKASVDKG